MKITKDLTDAAILQTLGERLARHRLDAGRTQAELAERAGIAKRTLERIEGGHGAELRTLARVLRALDLLDGLDRLLPDLAPSPIEQLKLRGKERQRVSHPRRKRASAKPPGTSWTWGED